MLLSAELCGNFKLYLYEGDFLLKIFLIISKPLNLLIHKILFIMNSPSPVISINLLPPKKLYCNFNYWSSLFSQDMQILWDKAHGVPLDKLPKGVSDMIFLIYCLHSQTIRLHK